MNIELNQDERDTLLQVENETVSDTLIIEILEKLRQMGLLIGHFKYTATGKSVVAEIKKQLSPSRIDSSGPVPGAHSIVKIDAKHDSVSPPVE